MSKTGPKEIVRCWVLWIGIVSIFIILCKSRYKFFEELLLQVLCFESRISKFFGWNFNISNFQTSLVSTIKERPKTDKNKERKKCTKRRRNKN
jgi:hypothetical protein